jgi:hypothetical protein
MAEGGQLTENTEGLIIATRPAGKLLTFAAWGKFDKASIELQVGFVANDNQVEWIHVVEPIVSKGLTNVMIKGNYFRLVVKDATGDTKINWWLG